MKRQYQLLVVMVVLTLSVLACNFGDQLPAIEPSQEVQTQAPPGKDQTTAEDDLVVTDTFGFQDAWGDYYIVGNLTNNLDVAVTNIELIIEVTDSAGESILEDGDGNTVPYDTFYSMLNSLAPGESTAFSYYISSSSNEPASYFVGVENYETTSLARADVTVESVYLYQDGEGTIYFSGTIVNNSDQWVEIVALAGAVLDASGNVKSADYTFTYSTSLAPTGAPEDMHKSPFMISLSDPGIDFEYYYAYIDAVLVDPPNPLYLYSIEITNLYFDQYDDLHIVGWITNQDDELLTTWLVAGLYAEDGSTLDATDYYVSGILGKGDRIPFDITTFLSLDDNDDVAALLDHVFVRVDPYWTYPAGVQVVPLTTDEFTPIANGTTVLINGSITNTSNQPLSDLLVIIYAQDAEGNLVAAGIRNFYKSDDSNFSPGETVPFEFIIELDPGMDTNSLDFFSMSQGIVE